MKILIFLFVVCFVKIGNYKFLKLNSRIIIQLIFFKKGQHIVLTQSSNGLNYTQITGIKEKTLSLKFN